ncbi:MAG: hypothetical protein QNJ38_23275 [Prochloraceae cyanobacterium]|nr:hypothetical protein [Prochloraceae cyanobacterium]
MSVSLIHSVLMRVEIEPNRHETFCRFRKVFILNKKSKYTYVTKQFVAFLAIAAGIGALGKGHFWGV